MEIRCHEINCSSVNYYKYLLEFRKETNFQGYTILEEFRTIQIVKMPHPVTWVIHLLYFSVPDNKKSPD